jgi:hypothetical protein
MTWREKKEEGKERHWNFLNQMAGRFCEEEEVNWQERRLRGWEEDNCTGRF